MKIFTRHTLRLGVAAAALALASLGVAVPQATAATCTKSGCNGKNPESYGCASDAKTQSSAVSGGWRIQLRYSKKCKAVWVRGENYHPVKIQAGYIDYYGHWNTQKSYSAPGDQGWITNYDPYWSWTPMVSIHAYERYRFFDGSSYWEWKNSIDGCSDSVC